MCRPRNIWHPVVTLLLAGVLPDPGAWGQNAAPPVSVTSSDLETFVVARPAAVRSASIPGSRLPDVLRGTAPAEASLSGGTDVGGDAVLTVFPGISGLETGVSGQWQGRPLEAHLRPSDWMQHGLENDPGFVQMGRADTDLLGERRGLRLLSSLPGRGTSLGVGLYRTDGLRSPPLVPGVDALWQTRHACFGAQMGLDSSWQVQSRTRGGRLEMDGFAGRTGPGGTVCGMALSARLSGSSTLSQRIVYRPDGRGLSLWALGGVQRVGGGLLSWDSLTGPLAGRTLHQTTLAFSLPLRRQFVSVGWQQSAFGGQRQEQVQAMTQKFLTRALTGWVGEGLQWQPGGTPRSVLTLGANFAPAGRWSARAEWTQNRLAGRLPASRFLLRGAIGCQCSPNLQIKLLYGPSFLQTRGGAFQSAWGVQITRHFQYRAAPPTGSIQGRVLLDGLACTPPLAVALDGQQSVSTDRQGRFAFRRVASGPHTVGLALASLPADMNPAETDLPVAVDALHAADVLLHLGHVGQVKGHLEVGPDEFGATDPTAAIGVTVTDDAGHATTTDADGNFLLGNLPPGRHIIRLVASTLPPHFCVLSPAQAAAEIVAGRPAPMLHFLAAPRRRPVQFAAAAGDGQP